MVSTIVEFMCNNSNVSYVWAFFWYNGKPYCGTFQGSRFYKQQMELSKDLFDANESIAKGDIQVLFDEEMKKKSSVSLKSVVVIYNNMVVFATPECMVKYTPTMNLDK